MELNYASKGVANAGLTTGIIGTALGALNTLGNGGGLLNLGGTSVSSAGEMAQIAQAVADIVGVSNNRCSENTPATRYDLNQMKELMAKDQQIAILNSENFTNQKIADVYERIMTRVNADQREQAAWNAQQMVNNAQMSAAIAANASSIAALQNCCSQITKIVVPNTSVCPGWGDVTIKPAG